jgi:DNA invertase Pin-like site-specific DNA recombinase
MANSDIDDRIRGMVEAFAGELAALIRESAFDTVRAALGEGGGGGRGRRGGAARASGRAKGAKRPPQEIAKLVGKLRDYVKAHPGQRIEQIAKGMGVSTRELNLPAKKLLSQKALKTRGEKRATKYFPK